jgi:23S rRNA pseudouridine1911/1915/1917 synthase
MMWSKKGDWLECVIPSFWEGRTIESLLKEVWCASKKLAHQLRMEKGIKLNGKEVSWQTPLKEKDRLQLHLYKGAGIDIHPSEPSQIGTLANAVAFYLQSQGILTKVRHIHRLDRDTSGTILFAKHTLAGATLDRMLEKRLIKRTYVALVHGILKNKSGTISAPIGRDRHHPTRRRVSKTGAKAVTHYRVLHTFPDEQTSLVELSLDTGRTHQIRVHMSYIGHPLVGDVLYGGKDTFHRQALHAVKLSFLHPFTNEMISCIARVDDFPVDIARFYMDPP